MKKVGGILLLLISLTVPLGGKVSAAACTNVSSLGAVTLQIPELRRLEGQVLWVRVQAPDDTGRLLAEVNETECLTIDFSAPEGEWSWQTYRLEGQPQTLQFPRATGNTIRLIGVTAGVKLDRVLLAEPDCLPQDFGNNCRQAVELSTETSAASELPSPSDRPVSGKVVLTPTPASHGSQLREVNYRVNNQLVQRSRSPEPLDTTLIPNGKHTVFIETVLEDGQRIQEKTIIEVNNPENFLTPTIRYIRLNRDIFLQIVAAALCLILIATLAWLYRRSRRQKRERSFHGF